MKEGFVLITGLDEAHNQVHRNAFLTPETTYISQTLPTVASLKLGETRIYFDGTDYWNYTKLNKDKLGRVKWTIV